MGLTKKATSTSKIDGEILKQIKKQLLDQKEELIKGLKEFTEKDAHNKDNYSAKFPQYGDKEEDNALEVSTYSDNVVLEQTLEKSLRDVNDSLKRIAAGTYGTCRYCGELIDIKRLLVRPTSSACVACKEKLTGGR